MSERSSNEVIIYDIQDFIFSPRTQVDVLSFPRTGVSYTFALSRLLMVQPTPRHCGEIERLDGNLWEAADYSAVVL